MLICFGFGLSKPKSKPKALPFASVIMKVDQLTLRTILIEINSVQSRTSAIYYMKECGESFILYGQFNPEPVLKALQKYGKPGSLIYIKFGSSPENLDTSDYYQRYAGGVEMQAPYPDYYQRYAGGAGMQAPYPDDYYQRYDGGAVAMGIPYVRNYGHPHNLHHA